MAKIGRNTPCPCGSGKKYKHCHGNPRQPPDSHPITTECPPNVHRMSTRCPPIAHRMPTDAHLCPPWENRGAPGDTQVAAHGDAEPAAKGAARLFFMASIESTLNGGYRQTPRASKTHFSSRRSLKRRRVFSRPVPGPLPGPRRRRTNRPRRRWGKGPASGRAVESGRGRNRYRAFPSSPGAPFPAPP